MPRDDIFAALLGEVPLPWEGAEDDPAKAARLDKLQVFRPGVLACLQRDPAARPSITQVVASWRHVFDAVATGAAPSASAAL